jgi:ATP-dependent helicase/nuclease subunit A
VAEAWAPTPEQRAAIEVAGSAAVRAGAGSGKTAVLAHRFVHLLAPGPDGGAPPVPEVSQVLAITFTEKAAAEMKRKIREVVAAAAAAATEATRGHWARVQRDLLGAQISTIHAFCARVLRENPLEARVDPRAVVLDEHETATYVEATVEAALRARLRAGDAAARDLVLRRGLSGGRTGGAVALCAEFLARLGRTGRDAGWLAAAHARQTARAREMTDALRAAAERLGAAVEAGVARGGKGAGARALAEAWPRWRAMLARLGPETPLAEFLTLRDLCRLLARARMAGEVAEELALDEGRPREPSRRRTGTSRPSPRMRGSRSWSGRSPPRSGTASGRTPSSPSTTS